MPWVEKAVDKKVQDIQNTLVAINGLLGWAFLSLTTRAQLESFKAHLEAELRSILSQKSEAAAG
jgi:hypothetical protein